MNRQIHLLFETEIHAANAYVATYGGFENPIEILPIADRVAQNLRLFVRTCILVPDILRL